MPGTPKYDWYDVLQKAAELVEDGTDTITRLAEQLGLPRGTLANALRREVGIHSKDLKNLPGAAKKMERAVQEPGGEGSLEQVKYRFAEDGSKTVERVIELSEAEMQDPLVIMRKMGLDPLRWEIITCELERKAWQVAMKLSQGSDENGNKKPELPHQETNYAFNCRIRARPLQDRIDQATIRAVFDELQPPKLEKHEYVRSDMMLEVGIYDPHFGKHAWADETGETHYDVEIADRIYRSAVEDVLARVKAYGMAFEKIIFPVGQDFFHIDSTEQTTTSGTRVDTDGRWQKIYATGVHALIWAIESLRELAPVHVVYVPGNHDQMLSFFATLHIEAYFRDAGSVTVDTSPEPRKYVRYGKNLIGFSHGRDEGKRITKLMQVEAAGDWGETRFREFHLGDLHHEEVREDAGIIFRRISTITATDAWHSEKGYKGAVRKAQAFVWDKNRGLVAVLNSGVSDER